MIAGNRREAMTKRTRCCSPSRVATLSPCPGDAAVAAVAGADDDGADSGAGWRLIEGEIKKVESDRRRESPMCVN